MATEGQRDTSITFKGVGQTIEQVRQENRIEFQTPRPIGIKTPLEEGQDEGLFRAHFTIEKTIADNLRNLLLTNHGERIGRYDFGANLRSLVFQYGEPGFEDAVVNNIQAAVDKYLPFCNLSAVEIAQGRSTAPGITSIVLKVVYTVPAATNDLQAVEVMIFAGG